MEKHENVFDTIKITKKLISPHAHYYNQILLFEENIYSYNGMNWQADKFLNDVKENDIILLYDRQYKEALILRIKSIPLRDKINDIIIVRNRNCNIHIPINSNCDNCNNSVELVFSNKYFEDNYKQFLKYMNEDFFFENMYAIYRNIEIIGKINNTSDIYHKYKTLQTSICVPSNELLLSTSDII
jgi:hypothetical protein